MRIARSLQGQFRVWRLALPLLAASVASAMVDPLPTDRISFRNEVMAVLSKAGCNAGACHGNQNGKAGFKLSLRGEDPAADHLVLTRDFFARRVDAMRPAQSLILLKATTQIAHEGGLRFRENSGEYRMVRQWIAEGATDDAASGVRLRQIEVTPAEAVLIEPAREVQIRVLAIFADGARRDATSLAVYEPATTAVKVSHDGLASSEGPVETTVLVRYLDQQAPVRLAFVPARPAFTWRDPPRQNFIDDHIFRKLRTMRLNPSEVCADHEFVRRASLDLIGLPPSAEEARAFVQDTRRDKRARWIETMLERPEFAEFWAMKWSDILRNEEKVLDRHGIQVYYDWIRESLAGHKPMDQFARELLAAQGSTYANPPANFYRASRDPLTRAEAAAQIFLGTRLQCARCHNHPYDRWTQADYYDWADVFARIQYKVLENHKNDGLDSHEFIGEQIVFSAREGQVINPRTGRAARPRFLGEPAIETAMAESTVARPPDRIAGAKAAAPGKGAREARPGLDSDALERMATWLTGQPNFARAQANWIWAQLMGRGLVDPVDDFRPTNPPTHPALLQALAGDFASHRFDLRQIIRSIMTSRTYQLSAHPADGNGDDVVNYSHTIPRRLSAEQLLDSQHRVLDVPLRFQGYPEGLRAAQLPGGSPVRRSELKAGGPEQFLALFGRPARLMACDCERSGETTLAQTFQLISSPKVQALLTDPDNRLTRLLNSGWSDARILEELFWTALGRPPAGTERRTMEQALGSATDKRAALEDLTWALLNAKEFVLRK